MDPDEREELLRGPRPGDDEPARLTAVQAMKVASILDAIDAGHGGWSLYLPHVVRLLRAAAIEASTGPGVIAPGTDEVWPELDALPWPPAGGPRPPIDG